jgi:hypothetical protein
VCVRKKENVLVESLRKKSRKMRTRKWHQPNMMEITNCLAHLTLCHRQPQSHFSVRAQRRRDALEELNEADAVLDGLVPPNPLFNSDIVNAPAQMVQPPAV